MDDSVLLASSRPDCPLSQEAVCLLVCTCHHFLVSLKTKGSYVHFLRQAKEILKMPLSYCRASLVAELVKNPPAGQESWVQSLGWEDPLEESMAAHSSILAWRIPMDRGAWQATVHGVAQSRTRLSD